MTAVLVVGVARSGTSWMGDTLGGLPGAVYVREPDTPGSEPLAWVGKRGLGWMPALAPGDRAPGYEQLWDMALAGGWPQNRLVDFVRRRQDRLPGALARWMLALARPDRRPRAQGSVVVVKSVLSLFSLDWIAARHQPRIVVIHRHPLNVLASWRGLGWGGANVIRGTRLAERLAALDIPLAEVAGRHDEDAVAVCGLMAMLLEQSAVRPGWLVYSHDDLCQDPVGRFRGLAAQVGLEWSPDAERRLLEQDRPGSTWSLERVLAEEADSWKRRLDAGTAGDAMKVIEWFAARSPAFAAGVAP